MSSSEGIIKYDLARSLVIKEIRDPQLCRLLSGRELLRRKIQWAELAGLGFATPFFVENHKECILLYSKMVWGHPLTRRSPRRLQIFASALAELRYLHGLGFLHGDLSCQNIIGFHGLGRWIDWTCCDREGSIFYRASRFFGEPEFLATGVYTPASETYAAAAILRSVLGNCAEDAAWSVLFQKAFHPIPRYRFLTLESFYCEFRVALHEHARREAPLRSIAEVLA